MKKWLIIFFLFPVIQYAGKGQITEHGSKSLMFQGLVMDAKTEMPISGAQIFINGNFSSVSDDGGQFAFRVNRKDTVTFEMLGYERASFHVNDSLSGNEFIAGIYMQSDTISISEVIIVPRLDALKTDLFNTRIETSREMENAKYNIAVSAYQGKVTQSKLGDPASNYDVLRQQQRMDAYTKGQIPTDRIVGLNPLLLIPAAYLLINGLPEKAPPLKPALTEQEINRIHKKYLERLKQK